MKTYKPDNGFTLWGLAQLMLVAGLGGPLIGGVIYFVTNIIYVALIFPLFIGLLGGILAGKMVSQSKTRQPLLAGFMGLLLGGLIYGSYHYFDYQRARSAAHAEIVQAQEWKYGLSNPALVEQIIDANLIEQTGFPGFLGFMIIKSQASTTFMHAFRVARYTFRLNLGEFLTWAYWLLELVIIAGIPTSVAHQEAKAPFCRQHNRWYAERQHLGGVRLDQADQLFALLREGRLAQVGEMLEADATIPSCEVYLQGCANCAASEPLLQVDKVFRGDTGKLRKQLSMQGVLSLAQHSALMQALQLRRLQPELEGIA